MEVTGVKIMSPLLFSGEGFHKKAQDHFGLRSLLIPLTVILLFYVKVDLRGRIKALKGVKILILGIHYGDIL